MTKTPLFTFYLPSLASGGAEKVLLAISDEIAKKGYRCDIVTAMSGGKWESRIPANVRHISLMSKKPIYSVIKLAKYLRNEKPDAVLASIFSANIAMVIACLLARSKARCILREAYRTGEELNAGAAVSTFFNKAALRFLYHRSDAVIALSNGLAEHILSITKIKTKNVYIIPNPLVPFLQNIEQPRHRIGGMPLILACGRLEPQKDFPALLEAFAIVNNQRRSRLVILGVGSQLASLKLLARTLYIDSSVQFEGHAPNPHEWMRQCDVFALTSRCEGFPNVLLEALDSGCQIVSTDSSDTISEILDNGRLGAIHRVGDVQAIAKSILKILNGDLRFPVNDDYLKAFGISPIANRYLDALLGG